ncbi:MAG TPA: pilus assembly protein PilE [Legionella sp.]|nr:pilus assembly protein PilE [Legionella sp.]
MHTENIMRNGFSLIELLMVLAMTSILAAISYPNYRDYITRAHRTEGKTALLDLACRMEDYYSKHQTYQTATIGTGNKTDVLGQSLSETRQYTLSIARATDETYLLTATTRTLTQDVPCPELTLNHSGAKGPGGGIVPCW